MLTFEEQLIAEVVKYPAIYDTNSRDYKDSEAKEAAWRQVTSCLKQPELKCKSRWKSLRDSFVCAIKRQGIHGVSGRQRKPWRFQKQMEFLLPYITVRKPQSPLIESGDSLGPPSLEDFEEDENKVYDTEAIAAATHFMSRQHQEGTTAATAPPSTQSHPGPPEETMVALVSPAPPPPASSTSPSPAPPATPAAVPNDWEQMISPPQQQPPLPTPHHHLPSLTPYRRDPINIFFESMAETVKRLPIDVQCRIKLELCRMVCEAEMAAALHQPIHLDLLHQSTNSSQGDERHMINGLRRQHKSI